jgi:hypothetical protein
MHVLDNEIDQSGNLPAPEILPLGGGTREHLGPEATVSAPNAFKTVQTVDGRE